MTQNGSALEKHMLLFPKKQSNHFQNVNLRIAEFNKIKRYMQFVRFHFYRILKKL